MVPFTCDREQSCLITLSCILKHDWVFLRTQKIMMVLGMKNTKVIQEQFCPFLLKGGALSAFPSHFNWQKEQNYGAMPYRCTKSSGPIQIPWLITCTHHLIQNYLNKMRDQVSDYWTGLIHLIIRLLGVGGKYHGKKTR